MNLRPFALALVSSALSLHAAAPLWPQFRGPEGASIALNEHPPEGLELEKHLLWKTELPSGASSPVVAGDRIFLTGFAAGKLVTLAVHRSDGSVAWKHEVTPEALEAYFQKLGTPAASSCTTDGTRVVSYFGSHGLLCFDLEGKVLWENKLPMMQTKDGFGTGSSPILHDGLVYLLRDEDGPGNGLYAFDVLTGKEVWKQARKDFRVSFGSPVVWDGALVVIGDTRAKGYDLKTGADRWVVRGLAAYPCTSPTVGGDGNLYVATWSPGTTAEPMPTFDMLLKGLDKDGDGKISFAETEGSGLRDFFAVQDKNKNGFIEREEWEGGLNFMKRGKNVVLALKPGGSGDITETHVLWSNEKGAPYVASPLYYKGRLFIVKDGGLATLYEAPSGNLLYDKQRLGTAGDYYASPVLAGNRIYCAATSGVLLELDPEAVDAPKVLSKIDLGEQLSASPAFVENKVYIRTKEHLWAFGAK